MKHLVNTILFSSIYLSVLFGQDSIGAGNYQYIKVTSSDPKSHPLRAVDGSGLGIDEDQASRFLGFASLGADYETIQEVAEMGITPWVEAQLATPPLVSFRDTTWMIWEHFKPLYVEKWGQEAVENAGDAVIPYWYYWKMAWWNNILKSDDHIRQRTAQALSQIFVISEKSNLQLSGPGMADYYDLLYKGAFGNFRDLLKDVTLHPMMGFYLSHANNPKSDPANNIHPDENYAREIMQLFSIGLVELNQDGTRKLDADGNAIPTYDNDDIKEFAKIFTGLAPNGYYWPWEDYSWVPAEWGSEYNESPATTVNWKPMIAFEQWHEQGEKRLLNGQVVPAGNTTMQDIDAAIDNLFNHPNVGPFIGRLLIQRLVKSNPTPSYIARVSQAFADNGNGVRGDMKAVIQTILTDPEALQCAWKDEAHHGKLREPSLRYTQMLRAFNVTNYSKRLWNWGYIFDEAVSQGVLTSPSVFNFYLPDYQPNGEIADADLVAPEFQIHTSATSINFINLAYTWLMEDFLGEVSTVASDEAMNAPGYKESDLKEEDYLYLDVSDEEAVLSNQNQTYEQNVRDLVDRIDLILTGRALSEDSKKHIEEAVLKLPQTLAYDKIVKATIYLVLISPDYSIQK